MESRIRHPSAPYPDAKKQRTQLQGLVFDIRSYAIHDGPGLRTTVFLKGCPLHCVWCCNPESQTDRPDLLWLAEHCLDCDLCRSVCPRGALYAPPQGGKAVALELCDHCGACVSRCPGEALNLMGRWLTVEEVLAKVMKDALCFENSGGGLTLSGGEPMAQAEFAADLLWSYKREEKGLHTVMETCGVAAWASFQMLAEDVDLFLYDIKHMDPVEHLRLTGLDNRLILDNASALAEMGRALVIRLPLIPERNDSEANLVATAEFVRKLPGVNRIDILPYHRLGEPKYRRLGLPYTLSGIPSLGDERVESARKILQQFGLEVRIGG